MPWESPPVVHLTGNVVGASLVHGPVYYFSGGANVTLSGTGQSIAVIGAAGGTGPGGGGLGGLAAGSQTGTTGTIAFVNGNGITFGMAGSSQVTASVRTDYQPIGPYLTTAQPPGAYLTTAALSQDSSKYAGTNGAATGASLTVNTSGVSINLPAYLTTAQPIGAYLTTAALSQDSSKYAGTAGSIVGGSLTLNTSGATISLPAYLTTAQPVGAYLTTARASNDAIGLATAQSNVTWTANSAGLSLDARGYAGTGTSATNASVTLNSAGIAISVAPSVGGAGLGGLAASNSTQTSGTVVFANSNGVSWSSGTQGVFATVATNYQSQGAYLTTAALSGDSSKYAGTVTGITGGIGLTANTSGISVSVPAYLTTARGSTDAVGLNTAATNVTWTVNSAGISLNAGAYLTTADLSQNSSRYAGTVTGITGGIGLTANTSGVSVSVPAYLTTAMLSNASSAFAGTVTGATNCAVTANTSGVSVSVSSAATLSEFNPIPNSSVVTNSTLGINTVYLYPFILEQYLSAYRLNLFASIGTSMSATNLTGSGGYTISAAIYQRSGLLSNMTLSQLWSGSAGIRFTNSSNTAFVATAISGISNSTAVSTLGTTISSSNASTFLANSWGGGRVFQIPISSVMSPGRYWLAVANSQVSANASFWVNASVLQQINANNIAIRVFGTSSAATNGSVCPAPSPGAGSYSTTTNAFPATLPVTGTVIQAAVNMTIPYFNFSAYTTDANCI